MFTAMVDRIDGHVLCVQPDRVPPGYQYDHINYVEIDNDSDLITKNAGGENVPSADVYPLWDKEMTVSTVKSLKKPNIKRLAQARGYSGDAVDDAKAENKMVDSFLLQQAQ